MVFVVILVGFLGLQLQQLLISSALSRFSTAVGGSGRDVTEVQPLRSADEVKDKLINSRALECLMVNWNSKSHDPTSCVSVQHHVLPWEANRSPDQHLVQEVPVENGKF